jgi:hypothetical protein
MAAETFGLYRLDGLIGRGGMVEIDGRLYTVMRLIEGRNLAARLTEDLNAGATSHRPRFPR